MVGGVDDEAAEVFAEEVDGSAGGGAEAGAGGFAVGSGVGVEPGEGHGGVVLVSCDGDGVGVEGFGDEAAEEDGVGLGEVFDAVDIGGGEDVAYGVEDGVFFPAFFDDCACAFAFVFAVVADPCFAEDFEAPVVLGDGAEGFFSFEGVGGGAVSDDGLTGVEVLGHVGAVGPVEGAHAGADDDEVGGVEVVPSFDASGVVGVDVGAVLAPGEEDGAIEAVLLGKDFAEHGHGFLGAVFFVAGDEDDFFAFAGSDFAIESEDVVLTRGREGEEADECESEQTFHGGHYGG